MVVELGRERRDGRDKMGGELGIVGCLGFAAAFEPRQGTTSRFHLPKKTSKNQYKLKRN